MYESKSRSAVEGALENLLEFGTFYDLDLQLTTSKGNKRWIRLTGNSLFQNDKIVKVWGMIQDITQIKQAKYIPVILETACLLAAFIRPNHLED